MIIYTPMCLYPYFHMFTYPHDFLRSYIYQKDTFWREDESFWWEDELVLSRRRFFWLVKCRVSSSISSIFTLFHVYFLDISWIFRLFFRVETKYIRKIITIQIVPSNCVFLFPFMFIFSEWSTLFKALLIIPICPMIEEKKILACLIILIFFS